MRCQRAQAAFWLLQGGWIWSSLAAYLVYVRQSAMPLNQFTQQINFILSALAGAERIFEMMHEEPEIDEGTVTLVHVRREKDGSLTEYDGEEGRDFGWKDENGKITLLRGDVRFENVEFGYVPGKKGPFRHQSLCKAGTENCVCGIYRSGKDYDHKSDQPFL